MDGALVGNDKEWALVEHLSRCSFGNDRLYPGIQQEGTTPFLFRYGGGSGICTLLRGYKYRSPQPKVQESGLALFLILFLSLPLTLILILVHFLLLRL